MITRKTLVREVVAAGRDPRTTMLREIAEEPDATIESDMPLAEAFHVLEERDLERVPVVDGGQARRRAVARGSCSAASPRTSRRPSPTPSSSQASSRAREGQAACSALPARARLDLVDERCDGCVELVVVIRVDERAAVDLLAGLADDDLALDDAGAHRGEHLAELGLGPDARRRGRCSRRSRRPACCGRRSSRTGARPSRARS